MKIQVKEFEADTLDNAKNESILQRPPFNLLFTEKIIDDGKPKTIIREADTIEIAIDSVKQEKSLQGEEITNTKVINDASRRVLDVKGYDEEEAKATARKRINAKEIIVDISLKALGNKVFLSFGKTPNLYEVCLFKKALVEVTYKKKAKIRVTIMSDFPERGFCQQCGKPNVPIKLLEKSAQYICSSDCEEKYSSSKLYANLLGGRRIFAGPGVDTFSVLGMQQQAEASEEYCWSCGNRKSMQKGSKCKKCGEIDIEI